MLSDRLLRGILASALALGLLASAGILATDGRLEPRPSPVALAVSLGYIQAQSLERGLVPERVLADLARAGVTTAVVEERTLADLVLLGDFAILTEPDTARAEPRFPGLALWRAQEPDVPLTVLLTGDRHLAEWALERARGRFGTERVALFDGDSFAVAIRGALPGETRLGLYPPDLEAVRRVGLRLVVQLHYPSAPPQLSLGAVLAPLSGDHPTILPEHLLDVDAVIFDGGRVWGHGRPGGPAEAGSAAQALGLAFALDPGAPPAGLAEFGAAAGWRGIKVQTVWSLGRPELFAEGIVERDSPLLIAMPGLWQRFAADPAWPVEITAGLAAFTGDLASRGLTFGPPEPAEARRPPAALLVLAGWGILAGAAATGRLLFGTGVLSRLGLSGAGAAALLLPWLLHGGLRLPTVQALTLLGSIAFPVVALYPVFRVWVSDRSGRGETGPRLYVAAREAVRAAILAAAGGLMILAVGGGPEFVLRIAQVPGIKASLAAGPILAVLLLWVTAGGGRGPGPGELRAWAARVLSRPLSLGFVVSVLAVAGVGFVYLIRSGNFPLIPVTDIEFELRSRLADVFTARPRTKEFLFGYPAVMLGVWLGYPALRRWWGYGLAALAGIGVSSVLNTFSHLHIPALTSVVRTVAGLGLGLVVGLAAITVVAGARRTRLKAGFVRQAVVWAAVLSVAAGAGFAAANWRVLAAAPPETRSLEVTFDLADLWGLAGYDPDRVAALAAGLAEAGATSVGLGETTVAGLVRDWTGLPGAGALGAALYDGRELAARPEFDPAGSYLLLTAGPEADDILRRLDEKTQGRFFSLGQAGSTVVLGTLYPVQAAGRVTLGFLPDNAAARLAPVAGTGLRVVPRPRNPGPGRTNLLAAGLDELRIALDSLGLQWSTAIFDGPTVPGYPDEIREAAGALGERRLLPGLIMDAAGPGYAGQVGTFEMARTLGYGHGRVLPVSVPRAAGEPAATGGPTDDPEVVGRAAARAAARLAIDRRADLVYLTLDAAAGGYHPGAEPDQRMITAFTVELSRALAARGRPAGPAQAGRPLLTLPGEAPSLPGLDAGLVFALVVLPWAGAALLGRAFRAPRPAAGAPARRRAWILERPWLTAFGLSLAVSFVGGSVGWLLLADARVAAGLVPVTLSPAFPLLTVLLVLALVEPWGAASWSLLPVWWARPLTLRLAAALAAGVAAGYGLVAVGGGLVGALTGTAVAAIGVRAGFGPAAGGPAVVGAGYAGSALALHLAASPGGGLTGMVGAALLAVLLAVVEVRRAAEGSAPEGR